VRDARPEQTRVTNVFTGRPARVRETASVMGATRVNCMILLILAGASYMGTSMAYTGIPMALANWVNSLQLSPYALIAALTVMYIVLGTALDGISMIVLTTAIVIPMVKQAGFDLVWFGIFLVLVVEMAKCLRLSASTCSSCRP
jgi:TRAP-type C4-dicarboxylate transport system permease large subunit